MNTDTQFKYFIFLSYFFFVNRPAGQIRFNWVLCTSLQFLDKKKLTSDFFFWIFIVCTNNVTKCENNCISGDNKKSSAYLKWTKKCWQRSKYFEVSSYFIFFFKCLVIIFFYRLKQPIEKPLVIILSWLLGKQKHIVKYVSFIVFGFIFFVGYRFEYDRQKRSIADKKN